MGFRGYKIALLIVLGLAISKAGHCHSQCCNPFEAYARAPHHLYFGVNRLTYQLETDIHDFRVKGPRYLIGLQLGYEYLKPCTIYWGIDFSSVQSNDHLKGKQKSKPYKDLTDEKTTLGNLDLRLGYSFLAQNCLLTPFVSLGGYLLDPQKHPNKGYKEEISYLSAGLRSKYAVSKRFNIGANLKVLRIIEKEQKLNFEGQKHKKVTNTWGGELGIPFTWFLGCTQKWDLQIEPYLLRLDRAEKQTSYGARLLLGYRF